jgi:succinoglycan biosynthesis protein ExoO
MSSAVASLGPAVSIVMANYNGARHLAEAIASAQRQTLAHWELILVDDASTDDSVAIAEGLAAADPRIRVLVQPRNLGPAAARNRALDAARGAWIAVVDSDDVMLPRRLERLLARARGEGADIVADDQLICPADLSSGSPFMGEVMARRLARVDLATFVDSSRLYSALPDLGFLKPLVRAEAIARIGARYDDGLRIGEDFHFLLALLAGGARLVLEPEPLYLYRKHGASISHRFKPEVLAAMIAADEAVRARLTDRAASLAMTRRVEGLRSWAVYEQVMAAAKAGRWLQAARAAAGRPHAWRLIGRPVGRRLSEALRRTDRSPAASVLDLSAREGI